MRKLLIQVLVLFIVINSSYLYSQSDKQIYSIGGNILVKGKITCETTGEPVGTEIEFRSSNGKKIRTSSNSISGEWSQVLPSDNYTVILHSWNVARKQFNLDVPASTKYKEINQDFTVKRLLPNDVFARLQLFEQNSSEQKEDIKDLLDEIKEIMKFNRAVEFTIYVSAADMYKPTEKSVKIIEEPKTNKKSKNSSKTQQITKENKSEVYHDYTRLLNQRYSVIKSLINESFPNNSRIKVEIDNERKFTTYPYNFSIIVANNYDIFGTKR